MPINPKYRYPLFFAGIIAMVVAGLSYKYFSLGIFISDTVVVLGALLFLGSIILP